MLDGSPSDASSSAAALLDVSKPRGAPVYVGTFVLANTILGAGMLGLPAAFAGCGYVIGIVMVIGFATCAIFGLHLLSEAANIVGRPATFHKVADAAVPGFGMLFDAAIAIKCFGVATSYLVVVKGNVPMALTSLGVPEDSIWHQKWLWVLIAASLATPLALLKEISKLRFTAGLSLICVVLIVSVVVLFAVHPTTELDPFAGSGADDDQKGEVVPVTSILSTLRELPIFVFAYTCHQNIISITNELERPSTGRALAGLSSAVSIAVCAYLVLAIAGYLTYGDAVASDVLESYPDDSLLVGVARIAISLIVTLCYPLQAHPSRGCITSIVIGLRAKFYPAPTTTYASFQTNSAVRLNGAATDEEEHSILDAHHGAATPDDHGGVQPTSNAMHYGISLCFILASVAIALSVDDLGLVLKVVGATGSTTVSYILPGACYLAVGPRQRLSLCGRLTRYGAFGLLVAGLIIMPLSLTLDFMPE
mmetsp:Transcript_39714/g.104885  ORF Transcript_39714/g.104885 Transcript_39714/m.104885 type:complete len:479 (-) Transcript_39714:273-1709(-)